MFYEQPRDAFKGVVAPKFLQTWARPSLFKLGREPKPQRCGQLEGADFRYRVTWRRSFFQLG